MAILHLANELLISIAEFLPTKDLYHFHFTCRQLSALLATRFQDIAVQDVGELTALQWAVLNGDASLAKLAISKGMDIERPYRSGRGKTPLHIATARNDLAIIDILARSGAKIDARDCCKRTPLHLAAMRGFLQAITMLLKLGADITCADEMAETPAHLAAFAGSVDCLRAFIDAGFNLHVREMFGRTVLHQAIWSGRDMIQYLLGEGGGRMIINSTDSEGATPLHLAAECEYAGEEIARLLIHYGADTEIKDIAGVTPARLAMVHGRHSLAEAILERKTRS